VKIKALEVKEKDTVPGISGDRLGDELRTSDRHCGRSAIQQPTRRDDGHHRMLFPGDLLDHPAGTTVRTLAECLLVALVVGLHCHDGWKSEALQLLSASS
jgi:hypothetical protein